MDGWLNDLYGLDLRLHYGVFFFWGGAFVLVVWYGLVGLGFVFFFLNLSLALYGW